MMMSNHHPPNSLSRIALVIIVLVATFLEYAYSFALFPSNQHLRVPLKCFSIKIDGYNDAFEVIDACAVSGKPSNDLYDCVRFIDKNAIQIYPNEQEKQALWDGVHGSWKLQMATGGGKYTTFKKVPDAIFAFAVIDEHNFGNGVGFNQDSILLSLLGPHYFNNQTRQMVITIDDMFIGANKVTNFVPGFIKDGMGLGKRREDYLKPQRPPAFTMIGASENALIARGGSGGIAIWTRLDKDIRPAAYGTSDTAN
jgi:hypothetical protein